MLAAADDAIVEAASDGADEVERNAPVRTGALRSSVTHSRLGWALAVIEAGGPSAPHVRPVESRIAWFNRSVAVVQDELLERVGNAIQEGMR